MAWWLVATSRETNCIEQHNDRKNICASSDLDLSLHTSFKTRWSEAIKSEHNLKTGLKRSESVHFEVLWIPEVFLHWLTGYDSIVQA